MKTKNELKRFEDELYKNAISLKKFLVLYCGISGDDLLDIQISHKDIRQMFPELKRMWKDDLISDKALLYTGDVVAVIDSYGDIAPYICPNLEDKFSCIGIEKDDIKIEKSIRDIIEDEDLKTYELEELCSKYKETRRFREYKITSRILKRKIGEKKAKSKKYKKEKKFLIERDNEYEY